MSEITEVEKLLVSHQTARVRISKPRGNKICRQRRRSFLTGVTSTV